MSWARACVTWLVALEPSLPVMHMHRRQCVTRELSTDSASDGARAGTQGDPSNRAGTRPPAGDLLDRSAPVGKADADKAATAPQ